MNLKKREILFDSARIKSAVEKVAIEISCLQGDIRRFKDRDVLVVDDVLDTGGTMRALLEALKSAGARSVKSCVLISMRFSGKRAVEADFKCFEAGSEFVYGYGLDFKGMYRNLADICIYRESETEEDSNDKTANH